MEKFISTLKFLFKQVMGLRDKVQADQKPTTIENKLGLEEINFLLTLIRESTFKGENVQVVYETAFKLQELQQKLKENG